MVKESGDIEHLNPKGLVPPPGGIYSHVVKAGDHIYISGQLGRDANGTIAGHIVAQYRQIWANLQIALASVGSDVDHLVATTTHVVGEENIPALREVRQELCPKNPPASTMVVVVALAASGALVEVDAIAVMPKGGGSKQLRVKRGIYGEIINALELSADEIAHEKVLCPGCREKIFQMWPEGWDAHSAFRCVENLGVTHQERKAAFKSRFRLLFR